MTAINSHVVREISKDCAKHEPDLFVIYMGNNEIVGPFGPGSVFAPFMRDHRLIRATIWGRTTKLGQFIQGLSQSMMTSPPFTNQLDHVRRVKELQQAIQEYDQTQLVEGALNALKAYRSALDQDPEDWRLHVELALLLIRLAGFTEAGPHALMYCEAFPQSDEPKAMLRRIIVGQLEDVGKKIDAGDEAGAVRDFKNALQLSVAGDLTEIAQILQKRLALSMKSGILFFLHPNFPNHDTGS